MINKITSFTAHQTAEGMRISYTYSVINENGDVVKSNVRASVIVMDDNIIKEINDINEFVFNKIPE